VGRELALVDNGIVGNRSAATGAMTVTLAAGVTGSNCRVAALAGARMPGARAAVG
jgi:hypothetical protein